MKILLPNDQLAAVTELLAGMSLKPAASRARTKLLHLVREASTRFGVDEYELISQYATLDDAGKPIINTDGTFSLAAMEKAQEFLAARSELFESVVEVSGPTYDRHLADIKTLLDGYEDELSGAAAEAFDVLYDAIADALDKETNDE